MTLGRETQTFDPAASIEKRIAEHRHLLGDRLTRLRAMSLEAAERNLHVCDLAAMDKQLAFFCSDLRDCCAREEAMVFPALLRLSSQTYVSSCQAGAVRARLRFMVAEQDAATSALACITEIARRHLSPGGSCESCHELLSVLEQLLAELNTHFGREQDELFAWALAREEDLVRREDQ